MTDSERPGARRRFETTRWTLVLAAGQRSSERSAEALSALCEAYWHPVYSFVRRQGNDADAALDLTQEFFARVIEKNYFRDADPARGRFRTFLLAAIRHFLANQRDHDRALKRGGRHVILPLDAESAEGAYRIEGYDNLTPEKVFDARWATVLLDRVPTRIGEEYRASGRGATFQCLKGFLTGDAADVPYRDAARTLDITEGAVKVAVHRLRRRFREALVAEIAETVLNRADIDAEIQSLLQAVSR